MNNDFNFVRVCTASPKTNVADIEFNTKEIIKAIDIAKNKKSKILVLPELAVTSYTCQDMFLHKVIIQKSEEAIEKIKKHTLNIDLVVIVGSPLMVIDKVYNTAFVIKNGKTLGIVPKSYIPNYSEFYEKRWFSSGKNIKNEYVDTRFEKNIPFGVDLIFESNDIRIGIEICEDLWTPIPVSSKLALGGANILCNLSASNELVSKSKYREDLVRMQSATTISSYIYSSASVTESTTDLVFSGSLMIYENGSLIEKDNGFNMDTTVISGIIDVDKIISERRNNTSFASQSDKYKKEFRYIEFNFEERTCENFDRYINKHPFIPSDDKKIIERSNEILNIQSYGLVKRIESSRAKKIILGLSGGLDSTLALLVAINSFEILKYDRKDIVCVTMPGFGTTNRTYTNAVNLAKGLGTTLKEISIVDSVLQHFKDIGHDENVQDIVYENSQARERTKILMDIANMENGLVLGTGDLSEMALGWSTYNGDQMSMYNVNASIPKTLVRYLVKSIATRYEKDLKEILLDIVSTPVSPELLKANMSGEINQKTEDIIGKYELHDFFIYYMIRFKYSPQKVLFLAENAFKEDYSRDEIKSWLKVFIKRFFTQQFKRSATPDAPKVGSVALSPRGDLRMSSDTSFLSFIEDIF